MSRGGGGGGQRVPFQNITNQQNEAKATVAALKNTIHNNNNNSNNSNKQPELRIGKWKYGTHWPFKNTSHMFRKIAPYTHHLVFTVPAKVLQPKAGSFMDFVKGDKSAENFEATVALAVRLYEILADDDEISLRLYDVITSDEMNEENKRHRSHSAASSSSSSSSSPLANDSPRGLSRARSGIFPRSAADMASEISHRNTEAKKIPQAMLVWEVVYAKSATASAASATTTTTTATTAHQHHMDGASATQMMRDFFEKAELSRRKILCIRLHLYVPTLEKLSKRRRAAALKLYRSIEQSEGSGGGGGSGGTNENNNNNNNNTDDEHKRHLKTLAASLLAEYGGVPGPRNAQRRFRRRPPPPPPLSSVKVEGGEANAKESEREEEEEENVNDDYDDDGGAYGYGKDEEFWGGVHNPVNNTYNIAAVPAEVRLVHRIHYALLKIIDEQKVKEEEFELRIHKMNHARQLSEVQTHLASRIPLERITGLERLHDVFHKYNMVASKVSQKLKFAIDPTVRSMFMDDILSSYYVGRVFSLEWGIGLASNEADDAQKNVANYNGRNFGQFPIPERAWMMPVQQFNSRNYQLLWFPHVPTPKTFGPDERNYQSIVESSTPAIRNSLMQLADSSSSSSSASVSSSFNSRKRKNDPELALRLLSNPSLIDTRNSGTSTMDDDENNDGGGGGDEGEREYDSERLAQRKAAKASLFQMIQEQFLEQYPVKPPPSEELTFDSVREMNDQLWQAMDAECEKKRAQLKEEYIQNEEEAEKQYQSFYRAERRAYLLRTLGNFQRLLDGDGKMSEASEVIRQFYQKHVSEGGNFFECAALPLRRDGSPWMDFVLSATETFIKAFGCNRNFETATRMLIAAFHGYSRCKMSPNMILIGEHSVGKSYLMDILEELLMPGTTINITVKSTMADLAKTSDISDKLFLVEEIDPRMAGADRGKAGKNETSIDEALWKNRLTSNRMTAQVWCRDENGKRTSVTIVVDAKCVYFFGSNVEGTQNLKDAFLSRFYVEEMIASADPQPTLKEFLKNHSSDQQHGLLRQQLIKRMRNLQCLIWLVCKLVWTKVFRHGVDMSVADNLIAQVMERAARFGATNSTERRHRQRVHMWLTSIVQIRAAWEHFYSGYKGLDRTEKHSLEKHFLPLEARLSPTFEEVAYALQLVSGQYENRLSFLILDYIHKQYFGNPQMDFYLFGRSWKPSFKDRSGTELKQFPTYVEFKAFADDEQKKREAEEKKKESKTTTTAVIHIPERSVVVVPSSSSSSVSSSSAALTIYFQRTITLERGRVQASKEFVVDPERKWSPCETICDIRTLTEKIYTGLKKKVSFVKIEKTLELLMNQKIERSIPLDETRRRLLDAVCTSNGFTSYPDRVPLLEFQKLAHADATSDMLVVSTTALQNLHESVMDLAIRDVLSHASAPGRLWIQGRTLGDASETWRCWRLPKRTENKFYLKKLPNDTQSQRSAQSLAHMFGKVDVHSFDPDTDSIDLSLLDQIDEDEAVDKEDPDEFARKRWLKKLGLDEKVSLASPYYPLTPAQQMLHRWDVMCTAARERQTKDTKLAQRKSQFMKEGRGGGGGNESKMAISVVGDPKLVEQLRTTKHHSYFDQWYVQFYWESYEHHFQDESGRFAPASPASAVSASIVASASASSSSSQQNDRRSASSSSSSSRSAGSGQQIQKNKKTRSTSSQAGTRTSFSSSSSVPPSTPTSATIKPHTTLALEELKSLSSSSSISTVLSADNQAKPLPPPLPPPPPPPPPASHLASSTKPATMMMMTTTTAIEDRAPSENELEVLREMDDLL